MEVSINDIRTSFKGKTFSNFKKNDVIQKLLSNLKDSKIEESFYMSCELICSGYFIDLWEIIFKYIGKYIHLANPKIPIYIYDRYLKFKNIINNGYNDNILSARNNNNIRLLFAEIICVLCDSNKKNSIEKIKLNGDEFDMCKLHFFLKADNTDYIKPLFDSSDPKELIIAFNELNYNLTMEIPNTYNACFWVEWIIEYVKRCKKRKISSIGLRRNLNVDNKFQCDIIWLIWDYLLFNSKNKGKVYFKIIESLYNLFSIRYNNASVNKRKYLIFFAIFICCENVNLDIKIIQDDNKINLLNKQINTIYSQIKLNEIAPATDYLFNNTITKSNLEKTIEKLDKMNKFQSFIPKIKE